jgi:hypothetical protein
MPVEAPGDFANTVKKEAAQHNKIYNIMQIIL